MGFPIKTCVVCEEEFELRPGKPGYANRCPQCSEPDVAATGGAGGRRGADELASEREMNAERRAAIKNMLYPGK